MQEEPSHARSHDEPAPSPARRTLDWLSRHRAARMAAGVLAGVVGGLVVLLGVNFLKAVPLEFQVWRWLWHPLVHLAALVALVTLGPARLLRAVPPRLRPPGRMWRLLGAPSVVTLKDRATRTARAVARLAGGRPGRVEDLAARALGLPSTAIAVVACTSMLATWIPHYVTWPWWIDTDQFAVTALAWHAGVLPYRDLVDFDFPAPIYVHYLLGQLAGWGRTAPFYALDAATVVLLGLALAAWSRRTLGRVLPGLVGYASFLGVYLGFEYSLVAQRDWRGPFFAIVGLLALEALPTRGGRLASAAAAAVALAYRPHVVLFLPAVISALDESVRGPGWSPAATARAVAEWLAAAVVASIVVFSPLILAGVFDDFLHSLRYARGEGHYNKTNWGVFLGALKAQLGNPATGRLLAALMLLAFLGPEPLRRPSRTWALALLGMLLYKPISPRPHDYLDQPLLLVGAVCLAFPVAWVLSTGLLAAPLRLGVVAAVAALAVPEVPRFCDPAACRVAVRGLARGEAPSVCPPGAAAVFRPDAGPESYRWADYCRMLDHVRRTTTRETPVAFLLFHFPFPPVNGPTGRPSPFPAAGGFVHLWLVDRSLEDRFVKALDTTPGTVVVWCPTAKHKFATLRFPNLSEAVRRSYRPEARFGMIEVWRRVDDDPAGRDEPARHPVGRES